MDPTDNDNEIGYVDISMIDLDVLDAVSDDALYDYFINLAQDASEGQLLQALDIHPGQSVYTHEMLVRTYAGRRHATALKLRSLRDS